MFKLSENVTGYIFVGIRSHRLFITRICTTYGIESFCLYRGGSLNQALHIFSNTILHSYVGTTSKITYYTVYAMSYLHVIVMGYYLNAVITQLMAIVFPSK